MVADAPRERRLALIQAHPDLANKTQRAAGLTGDSVSEQDGAGLDRLSDAEFAAFEAANNAYKAKFGFPFILCVRRHSKDSILDAFGRRLRNTPASEEQAALAEISQIASLRLAQLVEAPGHPAGPWPAIDPCAGHAWRTSGNGRRGRIDRAFAAGRRAG